MPLSARNVRNVLDFVGEAHGAGDLDELRTFMPAGLSGLVHTDYASYNEVGIDGTVYATVAFRRRPSTRKVTSSTVYFCAGVG